MRRAVITAGGIAFAATVGLTSAAVALWVWAHEIGQRELGGNDA